MHPWVGFPHEATGKFHTSTRLQSPRPFLPFTVISEKNGKKWNGSGEKRRSTWWPNQPSLRLSPDVSVMEDKIQSLPPFFLPNSQSLDPQPHTFFFTYSQSRVPGPSTASFFVQIILPSKWTGVSLKGSRWNWQETAPGEEKVNQLFNTDYNNWHLNRFLKDVEQSIIHFYLQKVTLLSASSSICNKCIT